MENAPVKLCIYAAGAVGDEPTTFPKNDAPHAVTAKQKPLSGILGKLKT